MRRDDDGVTARAGGAPRHTKRGELFPAIRDFAGGMRLANAGSPMRSSPRWLFASGLVTLLFACRGSQDLATQGQGEAWSPVCPEAAPAEGSSCSGSPSYPDGLPGLECEYGDTSAVGGCTTLFTCTGTWSSSTFQCTSDAGPSPALPADCPSTFAAASEAGGCSVEGESCAYDPAHVCMCLSNEDGSDDDMPVAYDVWQCARSDAECPAERPRVGSPCPGTLDSGDVISCDYGGPGYLGAGITLECWGGVWQ